MNRTRLSLYYLTAYLILIGMALVFCVSPGVISAEYEINDL